VYVDDLITMADTDNDLDSVKRAMETRFQMKDLGELHYLLGVNVKQNASSIELHQKFYIEQLLKRFGMQDCEPVSTPMGCK